MRIDELTAAAPPRRVLIIVENLPVPFDRRVWQEATALREAGYIVSVICPKGKGYDKDFEEMDGIQIHRHKLPLEASGAVGYLLEYSVALFWQFVLSLRVARGAGFDVIHACNPPDLIFLVALFHKSIFGKKFLFDQHDINPELYEVKFGKRGLFHRILLLLERLTFLCADGSLATNQALKDLAVARGNMSPDRVWVVRSFPDLSRFRPIDADVSAKRGFRYLVGYVGIMAEQDGVHLLIKAMDHIVNRLGRDDIACLIIGDGPALDQLRALSAELGLANYVSFTGYLTGTPLLAKLSACDIGVIPDPPNACNEKLSMNKVFEYMALGLPFVQFDLEQATKEAGDAGRVVMAPTANALGHSIVALLDDCPARKRMSRYGASRAKKEFSWAIEKHHLLEAYRQLLSSKDFQSAKVESNPPAR